MEKRCFRLDSLDLQIYHEQLYNYQQKFGHKGSDCRPLKAVVVQPALVLPKRASGGGGCRGSGRTHYHRYIILQNRS